MAEPLGPRLEQARAAGLDRQDPLAWAVVEGLCRRAEGADGARREALLERARQRLEALAQRPAEVPQERLSPVTITQHQFLTDSGGPGEWRGGVGIEKRARVNESSSAVLSFFCDRARSITKRTSSSDRKNPSNMLCP